MSKTEKTIRLTLLGTFYLALHAMVFLAVAASHIGERALRGSADFEAYQRA